MKNSAIPVIVAALALAACNAGAGETPPTIPLSSGDVQGVRDGLTALSVGQTLRIELPSNSTTGYRWQVAPTYDQLLIRDAPFGDEVTAPHAPGMVGVGGMTSWRFRTLHPGTATITFTYGRPWEPNARPADTATYTITVR